MVNQQRLLDLFLSMCRTNTPPRSEAALVDAVQERLQGLGLSCYRDDAGRHTGGDSGNLIATLSASVGGAPAIFFSAHFDTVAPNPGAHIVLDERVVRTDGRTILGADDKGGMAPIVEAVQVIVENELPHGEIQLLFTVCEEVGLLGARHLDRSHVDARIGFVLDTGPPVGSVVYTAPTQDSLDITITGRSAHAGFEPEKGVSAIQVAARAIDRMPLGRIDEETTANVGIIRGGEATNVVCPEVRLGAEARSREPGKLAAQVQRMVDAVHEAAAEYGAGVDVTVRRMYEGYRLSESDEAVRIARDAARSIGLAGALREAGGGSDANAYNASGLQACVLGTGMRNIHSGAECIDIADLVLTSSLVVAIAQTAARWGRTAGG